MLYDAVQLSSAAFLPVHVHQVSRLRHSGPSQPILERYRLKRSEFNGLEAVNQAQRYKPSLIVMDISIRVMDGLEAKGRILSVPEIFAIPIVAFSAHCEIIGEDSP
jgi:CheY-like chemotaxis protein